MEINCSEFLDLAKKWKGEVCLFGAGEYGQTWALDLVRCAGFHVDFYCDNNLTENTVLQGIVVKPLEYLVENKNRILCMISVGKRNIDKIIKQLNGLKVCNYIVLEAQFLKQVIDYVNNTEDEEIKERFRIICNDEEFIKRQFKFRLGYELNLNEPKTLNEKIQWLKINDRKPQYTQLADKYAVRQYIEQKFGREYLVPLLFKTSNYNELTYENIPNTPCIIKTNHGCGDYQIIRDKEVIDWDDLRTKYERFLYTNLYYLKREEQYKDIAPLIIIEKLLTLSNGKIPNDYKLHFINGKCEFIYCSVDREGQNYRKVYDLDWKPLNFVWTPGAKDLRSQREGGDIPCPKSFRKMLEIGSEIARDMKYVRVDFYDVEGKLYCGEITLHHGSGYDPFYPTEYDLYYGQKLNL